jgi:hypothetical protein
MGEAAQGGKEKDGVEMERDGERALEGVSPFPFLSSFNPRRPKKMKKHFPLRSSRP